MPLTKQTELTPMLDWDQANFGSSGFHVCPQTPVDIGAAGIFAYFRDVGKFAAASAFCKPLGINYFANVIAHVTSRIPEAAFAAP